MGKNHINRRKFLKYSTCGAMSTATMMSSIINLRALNAAAISDSSVITSGDYKALVCISLDGGNDSFNMLVPTEIEEHSIYSRVRSELALPLNDLQRLSGTHRGRTFGLHPQMNNIRQLYDRGRIAFISNIGTLIEPMTPQDFENESKRMPLGLLSHSDQLQQWQTAITHDRSATGWGGRIADMINDTSPPYNANQNISMNISLSGTNVFQSGLNTSLYSIDRDEGAVGFNGYNDYAFLQNAVDDLLEQQYTDVFKKTYIDGLKRSRDSFIEYAAATESITFDINFPGSRLGKSLHQIAKAIAVQETLGFKRQTFFVNIGGFDNHDELLISHDDRMKKIDQALNSFNSALESLGMVDNVVTFAISDFARTLGSNGNGTDHAWGGNVFAMGGPVKGGAIYGHYPETLDFSDSTVDIGEGILVPTTSADVYFAQLALWFGVSKSNLEDIFPNLINFYNYRNAGNENPLDFLTIS